MIGLSGCRERRCDATLLDMVLAALAAFIIVVVIPVGFVMTTTLAAGVIGYLLKDNAETIHADSELLDLNK